MRNRTTQNQFPLKLSELSMNSQLAEWCELTVHEHNHEFNHGNLIMLIYLSYTLIHKVVI